MNLRFAHKRAGYGLLGTIVIVIAVIIVLGWLLK
jgi:hypothetical protein